MPTNVGATWDYTVTEQPPEDPAAPDISVQVVGTDRNGAKELAIVETRSAGALQKTELIGVDATGIHCFQRTVPDDKPIDFQPPQTLLAIPLKIGTTWELDDRVAAAPVHQRFTIVAEENVDVPAGVQHAFRFHCDQPWPISVSTDRWFAPGIGFIKDVTTTRGPNGRLLSRVTTALKKFSRTAPPPPPLPSVPAVSPTQTATPETAPPSVEISTSSPVATAPVTTAAADGNAAATPAQSSTPAEPRITLQVAATRDGEPQTDFRSDAPEIFVRWAGQSLPSDATVRVAWVAEDVGDVAPRNFVVDETETTVTQQDFAARFTLSRPRDGWAAGKYRLELYLEDKLLQTVAVNIHD